MKKVFSLFSRKVVYLNMLAEFFASTLFSLLYFIFISRYLSPDFKLSYVMLSYTIGLSFFAAVFVPFYTYRINIIPFISVVNAYRKKDWLILVYKIPAQLLGALTGVFFFIILNNQTTRVNVHGIKSFILSDHLMVAFLNGLIAGVLCYGFYVIRILFKFKTLSGTILLGLLVTLLFFLSHNIYGITALNPFGLLFYDLLSAEQGLMLPWHYWLLIHVLSPTAFSIAALVYLRGRYRKPEKPGAENPEKEEEPMLNYDL